MSKWLTTYSWSRSVPHHSPPRTNIASSQPIQVIQMGLIDEMFQMNIWKVTKSAVLLTCTQPAGASYARRPFRRSTRWRISSEQGSLRLTSSEFEPATIIRSHVQSLVVTASVLAGMSPRGSQFQCFMLIAKCPASKFFDLGAGWNVFIDLCILGKDTNE